MQNNTKDGNNNERNLSEVFKELQQSRNSTSNTVNNNINKPTKNNPKKKKNNYQKIKPVKTPKQKKPKKEHFVKIKNKFKILRSNKKKFKQFVIVTSIYFIVIIGLIVGIIIYIVNSNKLENPYGEFAKYEKNSTPFNISQILLTNTETIKLSVIRKFHILQNL